MRNRELTTAAKAVALAHGADLVGMIRAGELPEHTSDIRAILPSARSVIVVAARHSLSALRSEKNEVAQFDTIHAYGESAGAAHKTARFLEERGFAAAALPAFIPLDMREPKKGMRGEVCWRRAGVRSGLGSYGENGLLVTREYGAAIRLAGLATEADLEPDQPLTEDACDHCMRCVEACPCGALSGRGEINKKLCGDVIFEYGFRFFQKTMRALAGREPGGASDTLDGYGLREMWQTFMTGNYYYCFRCQAQCPATKLPAPG